MPGSHGWPKFVHQGLRELEYWVQQYRRHECNRPDCKFPMSGDLDPNVPRRRYCASGCDAGQIGKADDACFLCDGPPAPMPFASGEASEAVNRSPSMATAQRTSTSSWSFAPNGRGCAR
jgi:hypothetical protein